MPPFGFIGGSSPSLSPAGDCQRTCNQYLEILGSAGYDGKSSPYPTPKGKSRMAMFPSPGLKIFCQLPAGSGRIRAQLYDVNSPVPRLFVIGGENLYEVSAAGVATQRGTGLIDDGLPGSMAISQVELCVCAGGLVFILNLATNVFTQVSQALFQGGVVSQVGFIDASFIAVLTGTAKFQISGLLNGLSWAGADIYQVEVFPDEIVTMIIDHDEILLGGATRSTSYYNSGDANTPYQVNPSAKVIECGAAAAAARDRLDNSVFWLDTDERGGGIARRLQGYVPTRISTHEVENQWATYPKISDAQSYSYQMGGHLFWQIYFPSALRNSKGELTNGTTWLYDVTTGLWTEREFVDAASGAKMAHRSCNHAFAFGKHLVGDWLPAAGGAGVIYEMALPRLNGTAWDFADDFGNPIVRERIGPHIAGEGQWVPHNCLALDIEAGLGPEPPLTGGGIPTFLGLADANGVVWIVEVQDNGLLRTVAQPETLTPLTLNDPTNATSWTVGVTTGGILTTTAATLGTNPTSYAFVSMGGIAQYALTVTTGGILQTTKTGDVARDPLLMLWWSDTSGKTWIGYREIGIGQAGKYLTRVIARMLGQSRDRVYRVTFSDPVPLRILEVYLNPQGV